MSLRPIHNLNFNFLYLVRKCEDPTEPFQCLESNVCISLKYLCDGHANDCPNNFDENPKLCLASKINSF